MHTIARLIRKAWTVGGWAPILVFAIHVFLIHGLNAYQIWLHIDITMHFFGGSAIAFFISGSFRALPRKEFLRSRIVLLELLLVGSLTVTAAALWELAEFSMDCLFGSNIQVSLANTMKDIAFGIAGAGLFILFRARQLQVGKDEFNELTLDWIGDESTYHKSS